MGKLAEYLEREADSLVGRWNEKLLADDGDDPKPRSELIEHLPGLLAETVQALRDHEAGKDRRSADARRHRLGFDLASLMHEHGVFRNVVLGQVEKEEIVVTGAELRIFIDVMADAIAHAVATHTAQRTEEAKRTDAQWRNLANALPFLVSFVDSNERYQLVNKAYEGWFGRSQEELAGRTVLELVGPAAYAKLEPHVRRVLTGETFSFEENDVPYKDAGLRDVRVSYISNKDSGGSPIGFFALLEDITERRRIEAERDRLAEERAAALAEQRQFEQQLIGIVSHDLRNPLNLISMAAHLLVRQDALSEPATKTVVRIQNATESAARLVRDLLDFTQARLGGGIAVDLRPGDLNELVRTVIDEAGVLYPSREVRLVQEGDGRGSFDSDRIVQMLQNLVTNALKYSPPGSVVKVVVRSEDQHTTLLVCNQGIPIPLDKLPVVFESFERAAGSLDKTSRSVGLGLYIVKHIVVAHRGTVQVESTEEHGTIFTVRLPR